MGVEEEREGRLEQRGKEVGGSGKEGGRGVGW